MAKIPQIIAGGLGSADMGVRAPAGAFGAGKAQGTQNLGQGIANVGVGLYNVGMQRQSQRNRAAELEHARWAGDTETQFQKELAEYMADPERANSPTFAADFLEFANNRLSELEEEAPSREAAIRYRQRAQNTLVRRYEQALDRQAATQLNNQKLSIEDRTSTAIHIFRTEQNKAMAVQEIDAQYGNIIEDINTMLGDIAPGTARALRAGVTAEIVRATASDNPEYARKILDANKDIDENSRQSLIKVIERGEKSINLIELDAFTRERERRLIAAQDGQDIEPLPIEAYTPYFDDPQKALVAKKNDDLRLAAVKRAHEVVEELRGKNPAAIFDDVEAMKSQMTEPEQRAAYEQIIVPTVNSWARLIDQDPVAWLASTNPEIEKLTKDAEAAGENESLAVRQARYEAILKYQGRAPEGEDPDMFLNKPQNLRHIMSRAEANQHAATINNGAPGEVLERIQQVLDHYTGFEHYAFNDLVSLPDGGGIRQEYQLAFQNKDAWWVDSYLGALRGSKEIAQLSEEKSRELQARITGTPEWMAFQNAIIGDNMQRAKDLVGYRSGIEAMTRALMTNGMEMKDAVERATAMLISESMGFTDVNGEPLVILRERSDPTQPPRTDEEIQDIGRRLGVALSHIDPRLIDTRPFADALAGMGDEAKLRTIEDTITQRAFWQTDPDGQSVSLYLHDDNGFVFQLTETDGSPITVDLDDLPNFTRKVQTGGSEFRGGRGDTGTRETEIKLWPSKSRSSRSKTSRTNIPVKPEWLN